MKLYLEESSWSGWTPDYKPKIKKSEYELKKDVKNIVKIAQIYYLGKDGHLVYEDREKFWFIITEIGDDFITIETNEDMSENEDGTISLSPNGNKFKIEKNKILKLTTLTMDYGEIYTFELRDE